MRVITFGFLLDPKNFMKANKNMSKQIVWIFSSKDNVNFFNTIGGSAQRLPNGNTFIASCNDGHLFEVVPADTSISWEYINPVTSEGVKKVKVSTYPHDNSVFRALRYTSDEPALAGQDLTPGNTITGSTPNYLTPSDITAINPNNGKPIQGSNILEQNYPNPFSNSTTIYFTIAESKQISLDIYDFSGDHVKSLVNNNYPKGKYSVVWNGTNDGGMRVANGMYFYILKADNQQISKKMISIK